MYVGGAALPRMWIMLLTVPVLCMRAGSMEQIIRATRHRDRPSDSLPKRDASCTPRMAWPREPHGPQHLRAHRASVQRLRGRDAHLLQQRFCLLWQLPTFSPGDQRQDLGNHSRQCSQLHHAHQRGNRAAGSSAARGSRQGSCGHPLELSTNRDGAGDGAHGTNSEKSASQPNEYIK
jgi:hypothetical protein